MILNPLLIDRVKKINNQIKFRVANLNDADDFVSVFNNHYKKRTNKEYFKWQFIDSPYPTRLFVAFDDKKLIGFCGVKILELQNNKKQIGYIIDLLISNEYRKRGIQILLFEKIFQYANTFSVCCIISLPNYYGNNSLNSIGFKTLTKVDSLVLNIDNYVSKNTQGLVYQEYNNRSFLSVKKNETYFNWRFFEHPNNNYDKLNLNEYTFAFVKIYKDIHNEKVYLDIMDIIFSDILSLEKLFDKIIYFSKRNSILNLTIWAMPGSILNNFLIAKGFKLEPRERYFSVYKRMEINIEIENINSWNLSQSDSETF
jgi:hypothetical protein